MTNVNISSHFFIAESNVATHECDSTTIETISLNHLKIKNLTAEKEKQTTMKIIMHKITYTPERVPKHRNPLHALDIINEWTRSSSHIRIRRIESSFLVCRCWFFSPVERLFFRVDKWTINVFQAKCYFSDLHSGPLCIFGVTDLTKCQSYFERQLKFWEVSGF